MKKLVVKLVSQGNLKKAWLTREGQDLSQAIELQFNRDGIATQLVEEKAEYILSWMIVGTPGSRWSLDVPEPSYEWKYYSTSKWYSTKISIAKALLRASYADLRVIRIMEE